ncbi:hypothetical protein FHX42_001501 [Saccharopolyspora lacisalsi]|uniref:Uncharacterized protein n=1 Tax=Halosaccharopolyspora lacisalsi TaxID=1000566 RepID=A0A839DQA6_9PSEU|nr:hypothetical protein [Halosaccharopolyspora lacisalsi]MBA8824172.1 hypothetical protein [Halosaccharopolyspora lacisalsi]
MEHARTEQRPPPDSPHEQLPGALSRAEQHARVLDARVLIECRFFGPCGANRDERGNPCPERDL